MTRVKYSTTVLGADGRPLAGAQVFQRDRATGTTAAVFAAEVGIAPADNPATTDATGRVVQWAERGRYAATVSHASIGSFVDEWDAAPGGDQAVVRPWFDPGDVNLVGLARDRPAATRALAGVRYDATDAGTEHICTDSPAWVLVATRPLSGLLRDRPAASSALAGVTYHSIDLGTTHICDATPAWVLINARPLEVVALPASPVDGQEVLFVASATEGILWHLRYRAASVSAYKWECIGGGWLRDFVAASQGTASLTYTDLATVGPTLTAPLAGDYEVDQGVCTSTAAAGNAAGLYQASINGVTPATDDQCVVVQTPAAGSLGVSASIMARHTAVPRGALVRAKYKASGGGTSTFLRRSLRLRPIRVG